MRVSSTSTAWESLSPSSTVSSAIRLSPRGRDEMDGEEFDVNVEKEKKKKGKKTVDMTLSRVLKEGTRKNSRPP
jgi:hypothetical protein